MLTANDSDYIDQHDHDAAFIRARRAEVGRDVERERLWERILELSADSGIPISMVARMLGEKE